MTLSSSITRVALSWTLASSGVLLISRHSPDAERRGGAARHHMVEVPGLRQPDVPPSVESVLSGLATGSEPDTDRLREAMLEWMEKDPEAACRFAFTGLPAGMNLKILPALMEALSKQSNARIMSCLSGIRTQKELSESWRLVVRSRMEGTGSDALDLALSAPPGARITEDYLGAVLQGRDGASIAELIARGLPPEWILHGLYETGRDGRSLPNVSALALYQALDSRFQGRWKKADLAGLLANLPPSEDLAEAYGQILSSPAGKTLRLDDFQRAVAFFSNKKPEEILKFSQSLPADYLGASIKAKLQKSIINSDTLDAAGKERLLDSIGRPESDHIVAGAKLAAFDLAISSIAAGHRKDAAAVLGGFISEPEFSENPALAASAVKIMNGMLGPRATVTRLVEVWPALSAEQREQIGNAASSTLILQRDEWSTLWDTIPEKDRPSLQELLNYGK